MVAMFLMLLVIGLFGLALMALPAFNRHGGLGHGHGAAHGLGHGAAHGHALGHGAHAPHALPPHAVSNALTNKTQLPADVAHSGKLALIPSPRAIFSTTALYGAFGNALLHAAHLPMTIAVVGAILPALLVERLLIRPLWNAAFRNQAMPSSAFEALVLCDARALTAFRNGKGLIETTRDGRRIQLSARLREDQRSLPVAVGAALIIEDVDAAKERVTVAVKPTL
jgi:hypothetical protein